MGEMCWCPVCGVTKPASEFYDRMRRDRPWQRAELHCRDCVRRRMREAYRPIKERIDALKIERGCVDCGYNAHPEALEFDHRPGEIKVAAVSVLLIKATWAVIEAEIAKCDLVCANCHRVRTSQRQQYRQGAGWDRMLRGLDPASGAPVDVPVQQLMLGD